MKNLIYLLPLFALLFTGCPDDEVIIPDEGPTQGLTAYYPLNGNAVDSIGRNDGEVDGPEATMDRHGESDGALAFDGRGDFVSIPNSVANNFGPDDDFALSLWASFGEQTGRQRNTNTILEKYDDDGELTEAFPFAIRIFNQDAQLPGTVFARRLAGKDADDCEVQSTVHASGIAINDEVFHHLVFQRSNGMLELYVDAVLQSSQIDSSAFAGCTTRNTAPLHLGSRYASGSNFHHFSGSLDDFRIYNRALSTSEITWLFEH